MKMVPNSRPKINFQEAVRLLGFTPNKVTVFGIRGYYEDTMGVSGQNDIGIYDDAIVVFTPTEFRTFNGNTDPSKHQHSIATLKPGGPYLYKIGMHNMSNPYKALRQFGNVTVTREGKTGEFTDSPEDRFYIDIHKGGYGTTSSLGCQTIHPDQWHEFISFVEEEMKKINQIVVPYYLVENVQ